MNPNPESPLADFLGRTVASVPQQDAGRPVHVHFHLGQPGGAAGRGEAVGTTPSGRRRRDWLVLAACMGLAFLGGSLFTGRGSDEAANQLTSAEARALRLPPPPPHGPQPGADLPSPGPAALRQLQQQLGQVPVVLPPSVPPVTPPLASVATPRPPTVPAAAVPAPARPARDGFGLER